MRPSLKLLACAVLLSACTSAPVEEEQAPGISELAARAQPATADDIIPGCPGITRTVLSYDGLAGSYVRSGSYVEGELAGARFTPVPVLPGRRFEGFYSATALRGGRVGWERGRYWALPDNPAIGAALALDFRGNEEADELYFVLGLRRSLLGRIESLCLVGGAEGTPPHLPFLLRRYGF